MYRPSRFPFQISSAYLICRYPFLHFGCNLYTDMVKSRQIVIFSIRIANVCKYKFLRLWGQSVETSCSQKLVTLSYLCVMVWPAWCKLHDQYACVVDCTLNSYQPFYRRALRMWLLRSKWNRMNWTSMSVCCHWWNFWTIWNSTR